jgi:hypothetical protein
MYKEICVKLRCHDCMLRFVSTEMLEYLCVKNRSETEVSYLHVEINSILINPSVFHLYSYIRFMLVPIEVLIWGTSTFSTPTFTFISFKIFKTV